MRKTIVVSALALALAGCAARGYVPQVSAGMGTAQYQADVRECVTATQVGLATGAQQGTALFYVDEFFAGAREGSPAAMDACMTKHGYTVIHTGSS